MYTVEVGTASYLDPWDWIGVFEADFDSLEDYVCFTYASMCRLTAVEKEVGALIEILKCCISFYLQRSRQVY